MIRLIVAKFAGICAFPECKKVLAVETAVQWNDETKQIFCELHPEQEIAKLK